MKNHALRLLIVLALSNALVPSSPVRADHSSNMRRTSAAFAATVTTAAPQPVRARHGMVVSTNRLASEVGVEVLKRGGNAVDAAVAVAFALAVTYPAAGNLGGGGFMMIRLKDGRATAIDYRETAPAAATRNVYLDRKGDLLEGEGSSRLGYRAAGVPGTVRGMELALNKYGSKRLTWGQLVEPARRLAAEGFPVRQSLAESLRGEDVAKRLGQYAESRRIFLNGGRFYREGKLFRQPELARTLARLQRSGAREFYEGETARLIVSDMRRHNGLMTREDLRKYQPKERTPLRGTYRGYEIVTMPPPSSGGIALLEMLNILEGYDLSKMDAASSEKYHLVVEAMRRAFADRAEFLGDTDFVPVPVGGLIDKSYAARLRGSIDSTRASKSTDVRHGAPVGAESEQTTHFTVVDREGNAVSNTYTLNDSYGAAATVAGTGFLLNNEMDDFAAKPGTANLYGLIQGERNAVAPFKRPLSSMTPTFVMRKDGSLWFTTGTPGGPTIINTVLQTIINVVDHDMNIRQAIDFPRIHHQWLPDEIIYEPLGLSADTVRALEALGHKLKLREKEPRAIGDAHAILIEQGTDVRLGASDPRNDGAAVGY